MAENLKLFNEHSEYESFIQTDDFTRPNVSYCIQEDEVHYSPKPHYARLYNGNELLYTTELCYDTHDGYSNYNYYHSDNNQFIIMGSWDSSSSSYGDFDAVEIEMFKGASNISVVGTSQAQNAQFTYSFNNNMLRIESTEGKWNSDWFQFLITYTNAEGQKTNSEIVINYND